MVEGRRSRQRVDRQHLLTGEVICDVAYWDFGGGFSPLELDESPVNEQCPVKYPLSIVAAYRPAIARSSNRNGTDGAF